MATPAASTLMKRHPPEHQSAAQKNDSVKCSMFNANTRPYCAYSFFRHAHAVRARASHVHVPPMALPEFESGTQPHNTQIDFFVQSELLAQ